MLPHHRATNDGYAESWIPTHAAKYFVSGHIFAVNMLYGSKALQRGGDLGTLHLQNSYHALGKSVSGTRKTHALQLSAEGRNACSGNATQFMRLCRGLFQVSDLPEKVALWKQCLPAQFHRTIVQQTRDMLIPGFQHMLHEYSVSGHLFAFNMLYGAPAL